MNYFEFIVKRKNLFAKIFFCSLIVSYLSIYLFVENQYEASATIIPRQDETSSLASSMLRGIKGVPLSLGASTPNDQIDLFKTIIFSRSMMESVVREFNLVSVYALDTSDIEYMEKAIKRLKKEVVTKETEESAFIIAVSANTPKRASDITNYIVHNMNERIIDLQVTRSRDNRIFLGNRVAEISREIRVAEDSLRGFQERTGLFEIKSQLEAILKTHATLETEFAGKQLQLSVMQRLYSKNAPQVKELEIQVDEYRKKLNELRTEGDPGSPLLALKKLPKTSVGFLDLYRDVEIDNLLLEYVMPLYEQAKIEEKKDYPVLQIIDYAIPPAKKSFPPRTLFSLIAAFCIAFFVFLFLILRDKILGNRDSRWLALMQEATHWSRGPKKPQS
jgi:capsule polysaccharide export protein KpsE/RkpR